jgi:RsmE family RNA methyltransferase
MNLLLVEPEAVRPDRTVVLDAAPAAHIAGVLRLGPGDTLRAGVVDGPRGAARVLAVEGGDGRSWRVTVDFGEVLDHGEVPPRPRVDLLLALPRPKVLRRLLAPLAAIGVRRVYLTNAERVERCYFDAHVLSPEVQRPLLLQGLSQARDTRLPTVTVHRSLRGLVANGLPRYAPGAGRVMADVEGDARGPLPGVRAACADARRRGEGPEPADVVLAVGPEGGWRDGERQLLAEAGFVAASAGPRALRSETACVALLALVHDALA